MAVPDFSNRPLAALQSLMGRTALVTGAARGVGRVLSVNLRAAFVASREFARHLKTRRAPGVIVNIASVSAIRSAGSAAHYVASKHGMAGLTKSLAEKFGKSGPPSVPPSV
jgi:NAD(P)-dependent dehydrogenase (short-subunit alcohol dehydrogenase family)